MVRLLRELVEIESPSSDIEGVRALAVRLVPELAAAGMETELLAVEGAGPVLRARWPGVTREGTVMLLGHLDTVWPQGTLAERPVRIEGDILSGPGSFDMKAGLVIVVFALRELAERDPPPPVTVFFTPREEVNCEPYREVMEREMRASTAVLGFEPAWPGGAVKTARKGAGSFLLRARGRAAHAGANLAEGANAIVELARKALEASALGDPESGVSVNVGLIRGGIAVNVVPDLAEAELDVRYSTLEDGHRTEAALRALRSSDTGVTLELEGGLHCPPLERTRGVLRVFEQARLVAGQIGIDLEQASTGGGSEASYASALGIPTLDGLGADGDGAHAEHEHVRISSLPERVALTAGLIEALVAGAHS